MREERRSSTLVLLGKKAGKTETRGTVSNQMEKKLTSLVIKVILYLKDLSKYRKNIQGKIKVIGFHLVLTL